MMEFRKELDALLDNFWINREQNGELYQKVKDAIPNFRELIDNKLGAKLIVNNYLIKLEKNPVIPQSYMGIKNFDSRLDYVLLMLVISFLEAKTNNESFILSQLTSHIEMNFYTLITKDVTIDWTKYRHRRALVKVMDLITELGLVRVQEGDVSGFASDYDSEVLYQSTGASRYMIRQFASSIYGLENYKDIIDSETSNLNLNTGTIRKNQAYRKLIFSPLVVSNGDEDYDYEYIRNYHNNVIANDINKYLDADLHVHRNMAMVVASNEKRYKDTFPSDKALSDIVCLVCTLLRKAVDDGKLMIQIDDTITVSILEMKNILNDTKEQFKSYFSKEYKDMKIDNFYEQVINYMAGFNMLVIADNVITIYPVVFKYAGEY